MSTEAVYWLATQGAHVETPSSKAIGAERVWRVLQNLAAHADETTGELWVSDRTQEKETGIPRRLIREARVLLEQAGLLTDTGKTRTKGVKVLCLHLPGYAWRGPVNNRARGQVSGQASGQASGQDSLPQTEQNRITPQPPTHERRRQRENPTQGGGMEWGELHEQVLSGCLERERKNTRPSDWNARVQRKVAQDYRPIVAEALLEQPNAGAQTLVAWCYATRNGQTPAAPARTPAQDCETCNGQGVTWGESHQDEQGNWVSPGPAPCPTCTQGPTRKRVSLERSPNTDTPGPGGPADPRSAVVRELPRIGRAV